MKRQSTFTKIEKLMNKQNESTVMCKYNMENSPSHLTWASMVFWYGIVHNKIV